MFSGRVHRKQVLRASGYQSMIALTAFTAAAPMARTFKPPPHPAFPCAPTPDPEQLLPSLSKSVRVSRTAPCGPTSSPSMAPRRYLPSSRLPQTTRSSGAPLLEHETDAVTPVMLRYFVMRSLPVCAAAGVANATRDVISAPEQILGFCDLRAARFTAGFPRPVRGKKVNSISQRHRIHVKP